MKIQESRPHLLDILYIEKTILPFYFRKICLHHQRANLRLGDFFLYITGICSCMNFIEIRQKRVTWLKIESLDPPEDIRLSPDTETDSGQEDKVFHSLRWSAAGACFTTLRDKWKHLIFILWFHFTFSLLSCFLNNLINNYEPPKPDHVLVITFVKI